MGDKKHFVVVCGYGCHLVYPNGTDPNLDGKPTPLAEYLDEVGAFIQREKPYCVIFCGGLTQQRTAPGMTEAEVMCRYVLDHFSCKGIYFRKEIRSYNTHDNILFAAEEFLVPLLDEKRITVFCETQRALKTIILARHFMSHLVHDPKGDISVRSINWERGSENRELFMTNLVWLSIRIPYLAARDRRSKMKKSKNR